MTHFKKISHIFKGIVLWYFKTFFEVCDHEGHCFFFKSLFTVFWQIGRSKEKNWRQSCQSKSHAIDQFHGKEMRIFFVFKAKLPKGWSFTRRSKNLKKTTNYHKSFYQLASFTGAQITTKVGDLESSFDKIEFCPTFDRSYNFSSTVVFSFNYSQPLKYFSF